MIRNRRFLIIVLLAAAGPVVLAWAVHSGMAFSLITGPGPAFHHAEAWHEKGFTGRGVKVGVIDLGFNGVRSRVGGELPDRVYMSCMPPEGGYDLVFGFERCKSDRGLSHGTAVAEALTDVAPGASLYLFRTDIGYGFLRPVVDWMASEGVTIIITSMGWSFDGPGDGTSPWPPSILNVVDYATEKGILWVNSAGNQAMATWFGPPVFVPSDDPRVSFMEFAPGDVDNDFEIEGGPAPFCYQLRWEDDWSSQPYRGPGGPGARRDLDLLVWSRDEERYIYGYGAGRGSDPQGERGISSWPYEGLCIPLDTGSYALRVGGWEIGDDWPAWVQVMRMNGPEIEHYTLRGSIDSPAESRNEALIAVGAVHWESAGVIEPYSGRGPAPDGRQKPDITGATCGETSVMHLCGTSGAAPHIAGLAALVKEKFPDKGPIELAEYLKRYAIRMGERDEPDNTWGYGIARLQNPWPPQRPYIIEALDRDRGPDWLAVSWYFRGLRRVDVAESDVRLEVLEETGWRQVSERRHSRGDDHWRVVVDGLLPDREYRFRVRGVNDWGVGPWSEPAVRRTLELEMPPDPLIDAYDANGDGIIQRAEVIAAINDYLDGLITREDVIRLIEMYLSGG